MVPWIFVHDPLERWMADYKRIFDAWAEGGVRGLVFGYMQFKQDDGTTIPSFASDPKVFEAFGETPPPPAARDPQKEKQLHAMLDDAASRGWNIMIFAGYRGLAGTQDIVNAYPQAHGVISDGPGENHYELPFHHGGKVFEIRAPERFEAIGADVERMQRGIDHLSQRFHNLTPGLVRYHAPGGMLGTLNLFDLNEDVLYWLRMRQEWSHSEWRAARANIDRLNRRVQLGAIPRTAAFSSLTGQNYQQMTPYYDFIFPKHYYWHRGFDGLYGTVARWVQTLSQWNPSLTEEDCFSVVRSIFGIDLPGVRSLMDMEMGFPDEFFSRVVYGETRRALAAIGDDDKVIAWVSTGRSPHAGDAMPVRDLVGILRASQEAGLKRFIFHPDPDLGAAEWRVMSDMCGKRWDEGLDGYWPSDTDHPQYAWWTGHPKRRPRPK